MCVLLAVMPPLLGSFLSLGKLSYDVVFLLPRVLEFGYGLAYDWIRNAT